MFNSIKLNMNKIYSLKIFSLMFGIIFLLNLNYTILKNVRKTLAIVDLGGSASVIPFYELFGVLPAALLLTWFLTYILKKNSMRNVFLVTLFIFISFFFLFSCICYPKLSTINNSESSQYLLKLASMSFYVVGELWKPMLIQILFLGFININLDVDAGKKIYPLLMLGSSLGAIAAGPLTIICNSSKIWEAIPLSINKWSHSFLIMMSIVFVIGSLTGFLYIWLSRQLKESSYTNNKNDTFSLKDAFIFFMNTPSLKLMGWLVFADYIAYSLAEVIFLELLKLKYPLPCEYCSYMGYLSFWHSLLTLISALCIAPFLLKRTRWITSAMILPLSLLIIEVIFFTILCSDKIILNIFQITYNQWLSTLILLGSVLFCSCRAIKYTIFDPAKEIAFIQMPKSSQIKGKLIIDGLCSKFGKGIGSATTMSFSSISGSLIGSAGITSVFSISICFSLVFATRKLGSLIEGLQKQRI